MSMVLPPAGVAGGLIALACKRADTSTASSCTNTTRSPKRRRLAVLACALSLFAASAGGAVALPLSPPGGGVNSDGFVDESAGGGAAVSEALFVQPVAGGQFIADFAMQFQGYPYVWAGNTPAGFDCSGFTQYVLLNMLGIDIGHDVAGQTGYGAWVDWGAWQPGDLVYFAGTYRPGISHTGVYIGDGLFIHAENPGTGVVVSSIYSGYYSGHYYGAFRHV